MHLIATQVRVLLCQPEVDDVNLVRLLAKADQEVIRLNVAMDEILCMHVLNPVNHLVRAPERMLNARRSGLFSYIKLLRLFALIELSRFKEKYRGSLAGPLLADFAILAKLGSNSRRPSVDQRFKKASHDDKPREEKPVEKNGRLMHNEERVK